MVRREAKFVRSIKYLNIKIRQKANFTLNIFYHNAFIKAPLYDFLCFMRSVHFVTAPLNSACYAAYKSENIIMLKNNIEHIKAFLFSI